MPKRTDHEMLEELRKYDTPSITNVVATYPDSENCLGLYNPWTENWYTDTSIRCMYPELGRTVGYAVTCVFSVPDPNYSRLSFMDVIDALDASPKPTILILQQKFPPELANKVGLAGSIMTTAMQSVGCIGVISNGPSRDIEAIREMGFGQRQRVMLAIALACGPSLLIADEPTSALDPPVQLEIVQLLAALTRRREMALLLITHDLGLVGALCARIAVMYAGRIVEEGRTEDVLARARHPYTQGLLAALAPIVGPSEPRFQTIPGQVPALGAWPPGCRFAPRCPRADAVCVHEDPALLHARSADDPALRAAEQAGRHDLAQALRGPDPALETGDRKVACHHPGPAEAPCARRGSRCPGSRCPGSRCPGSR
jgi:oligopeptide/dipeptide ABC transporter ATP-binding protein